MTGLLLRTRLAVGLLAALACLTSLPARADANAPPEGGCASAHPLATQACVAVLARGGNAFDAAVATSATLAVVEPFGSGLGGGGFFLLHLAGQSADSADIFLDGRERAPLAATPTMYRGADGTVNAQASLTGAKAAAIPHQHALLAETARRFGSRPLAELLAPAIAAARDGFAIDGRLAREIAQNLPRFNAEARAVFAPGGVAPAAGSWLRQPALADTLSRFAAHGAAEFTSGETGQRLLRGVRAEGGLWQADDLLRIQASERPVLRGYFRDYRITTVSPPSAGGATLLQALTLLEAQGYRRLDGIEARHQVIEALRRAYRDRNAYFGDPDFVDVPLYRLLSRSYLLPLAATIKAQATPSKQLPAPDAGHEGGQTTHFSVIDAAGNRVAGTQSLNLFFGSGTMPAGTGVMLNDEMDDFSAGTEVSNAYGLAGSRANAIAPFKKPLSSMTPTFVEGPRGVLVTGTPGGSRIPSMVLLSVLKFVDGASAAEIAATPRFHHQWLPDVVQFEPGAFSADEQAALVAKGHTLAPLKEPYGNLQVVLREWPGGRVQAAADPRWNGSAEVVTVPVR